MYYWQFCILVIEIRVNITHQMKWTNLLEIGPLKWGARIMGFGAKQPFKKTKAIVLQVGQGKQRF